MHCTGLIGSVIRADFSSSRAVDIARVFPGPWKDFLGTILLNVLFLMLSYATRVANIYWFYQAKGAMQKFDTKLKTPFKISTFDNNIG